MDAPGKDCTRTSGLSLRNALAGLFGAMLLKVFDFKKMIIGWCRFEQQF